MNPSPSQSAPPLSEPACRSGTMEDGEASAAAFEAALGLNPRYLIDETLDIVDDIGHDAIQYARQLRPLRISSPRLEFLLLPHSSPDSGLNFHFRSRFSREAATEGVLGATKAAQKAAELDRVSGGLLYCYGWED
ncbi:hypothetical protein PR202_gb06958 [Eleusine coracana subsp. coracana]|uniref:Uncharacterized protein n=1 Tax=Eleusine coracana subsp. coracana TaxID=191504 RepID=A0AAV5E959_ELECO|nr:hypothetical protein PR202_gb06958 [Eleusine coracana subsp. coracana]